MPAQLPLAAVLALSIIAAPGAATAQTTGVGAGPGLERFGTLRCNRSATGCMAEADFLCRVSGGYSRVAVTGDAVSMTCGTGPAFRVVGQVNAARTCTPSSYQCTCSGDLTGGFGSVFACMVIAINECASSGGQMHAHGIIPDGPDSGTFFGNCFAP